MKVTGEQVVLGESSPRTTEEHTARYAFASTYVAGKRVLDIACGSGYGVNMLREAGASLIEGVDISEEAILFAKQNFGAPNVTFTCASAADTLFPEHSFDVVTSFETIEHLEDETRRVYLQNLHKWLVPNGILILSTPNKKVTSPFTKKPLNPFHILEYRLSNLRAELEERFTIASVFGQRLVPKIATLYIVRRFIRVVEVLLRRQFTLYDTPTGPEVVAYDKRTREPRFFVLLCRPR